MEERSDDTPGWRNILSLQSERLLVSPEQRYAAKMASTLTKLLVHIAFSTKNRVPIIRPEIEPNLFAYVGGICRAMNSPLLAMNGVSDHVHIFVSLSKNIAMSDLLLNVKRDSSKWVKDHDATLRDFAWQDGYFGFSIGESQVDALQAYIARQKEHHKTVDFKEEMRTFFRKYGIEWDERFVWS